MTLEDHPNNLPLQPTPLVGREREVEEVIGRVQSEEVRLLTLTGPGGTGKTRLALQAAAELLEDFDDGVFFVSLAALTDPELVSSTIAETVGITESADRLVEEGLREYVRGKRLLLLVDNFEHVLSAAPLVAELSASCRGLKVLATSRVPLGLYGEHEYAVPSLTVPDVRRKFDLEALSQYEAVRLFIERASAAKADFAVTDENAPAVAEICARLDGLPLAIELAAARVKLLPPQKMLSRLDNRLKLLTGGARNLPERHRTLRGTIDWSYELLDERERKLFRRLSVFSGGRTLEAIEEVCDPEGDLDALEGVESLLEKSLVRQEEGPVGEPRFVMMETIHEYACEKLRESGEEQEVKRAHAEHFLALAEEAEPKLKGPDQLDWLERLEAELDNMRAALSWSLGGVDAELGLKLAGSLWWFWLARGHLSEGVRWLEGALAENLSGPAGPHAKALLGLGRLVVGQNDLARGAELLEESLGLYRALGDDEGTARALSALGYAATVRGEPEQAETLLRDALTLSRRLGDHWNVGIALNSLGCVAYDRGDRERAAALWNEGLALARERRDPRSIAMTLNNVGLAAMVEGDFGRAAAVFEEILRIGRELQDRQGVAYYLDNLGWATLQQGEHERAAKLLEEGLKLSQEVGDWWSAAECLEGMARLAAAAENAERTAWLWGAAQALREEQAFPIPETELPLHKPYQTFARFQLEEAAFRAAFDRGRNKTLDEAISYALEECPASEEPAAARPAGTSAEPPIEPLTHCEIDVLRLIAEGRTNPEIAKTMFVSVSTVKAHVQHIIAKLGVSDRTQAAVRAGELGLLSTEHE
jgi:predicted ATPase/DNA-binding CsgD family transcriptional regulator/Tfp pilus assembly protein PilF